MSFQASRPNDKDRLKEAIGNSDFLRHLIPGKDQMVRAQSRFRVNNMFRHGIEDMCVGMIRSPEEG